MNADFQYIEQAARQSGRRLRWAAVWQGLWQGLALGAAIWVGVLAVHKLLPVPDAWPRLVRWAVPIAALVGMLIPWFRGGTLAQTIQWMDLQLGMKERLVTAWELASQKAQHPWAPLVIGRAAQALRQTPWPRLVRLHLPRQASWASALLLAGFTLLWIPEYRTQAWRERQRQAQAQREAGRELVAFARQELRAPDLAPEVQAALLEIESIGHQLLERTWPPEQALQALAELARRLEAQARATAGSQATEHTEQQATRTANNSNAPFDATRAPSSQRPASQPSGDQGTAAQPQALAAQASQSSSAGKAPSHPSETVGSTQEQARPGSEAARPSASDLATSGLETSDAAALPALAQRLDQLAGALQQADLNSAEQQRIASELESLLSNPASSQAARQWIQSALKDLKAGNCLSAAKALSQAASACRGAGQGQSQGQRLLAASRKVAQAAACVGTGRSWMECSSTGSGAGGSGAGNRPGGDLYNESVTAMPRPAGLAPERLVGPWLSEGPMPMLRSRGEALQTPATVAIGEVTAAATPAKPQAVNLDRIPRAYRQTVRSYFDESQP